MTLYISDYSIHSARIARNIKFIFWKTLPSLNQHIGELYNLKGFNLHERNIEFHVTMHL